MRDGWEKPKEVKIVRDTIVAPTLDFEMKEGNVAYIRLHSFNANANRLFYQAVLQGLSRGAKGMVLDMRNNPGGYLEVAVDLAGWFVPRGMIVVSEEGRAGVTQEFRAEGNAALEKFPVVVLVNGGSASASEILAGALRDLRDVKLVGEKTFGKGTVQQIVELRDGSSMKLTIAHWVLPSGKVLEGEGLEPDIEVVLSDEDLESENDVQLTKALEVLRPMMQ
jgi:carboxyl-terminal processing protease